MRASREKFAESRERILAVAAKLFREKGFDGIGLADIMKAAGLTHGGFYRHFGSKDDLEAQAIGVALATTTADWSRLIEHAAARPLSALTDEYLSPRHRDDPGKGCALAALGADVARQGERVRSAFTAGLKPFLQLLSNTIPGRSKAVRRRKAIATMAELIGTLILARAVDDTALSDEILAATSLNLSEVFYGSRTDEIRTP
ncbi:MAG TPA: TetR/AcrR family transcriptional regulator [Stellaceae bacterium]|jgi:TetR/AcrR family transcriptional repressor of nem operon|nr:TetR/AcrR family transcriptional regulator [Stellaceae bacterium]